MDEKYQNKYQQVFHESANCIVMNDAQFLQPVTLNAGEVSSSEFKNKLDEWQSNNVDSQIELCNAGVAVNTQEELCMLIHPKLYDNDRMKVEVHNEIKGLVTRFSVQDICSYLNDMKSKERVLLPTSVLSAYDELKRMGMPTDKKGYDYKTFAKYYNKL